MASLASAPSSTSPSSPGPSAPGQGAPSSRLPLVQELPELKRRLQEVCDSRGHVYTKTFALLTHWELDDTNAAKDVGTMKSVLETMIYIHTKRVTLRASDPDTEGTLQTEVRNAITKFHKPSERSLFILYYVGHGAYERKSLWPDMPELVLIDKKARTDSISFNNAANPLYADHKFTKNLDVLIILDCCFPAAHAKLKLGRTVQILAASKSITMSRDPDKITFTQDLCNRLHIVKSRGYREVSVNELFAHVTDVRRTTPQLLSFGGVNPIMLSLEKPWKAEGSLSPVSPVFRPPRASHVAVLLQIQHEKSVIVKLTLNGSYGEFDEFKRMIKKFPRHMEVEIIDAYLSQFSFFCLLRMPWESWAGWTSVCDLETVKEVSSPSLFRHP